MKHDSRVVNIYLPTMEAVLEFVDYASKCDFRVKVSKKGFKGYIDGRSILGMLSIVGEERLDVRYNGRDGQFENVINRYAGMKAACEC